MRQGLFRTFARDTAGTTAVEFALVALPLFMLIFGTVEFARLMWTREALQSAAIAGARCMGIKETACAPAGVYSAGNTMQVVRGRALELYVAVPASDVTLTTSASCSGSAGFARVQIDYTFESLIAPLLDAIDGVEIGAVACFPNQS